jgi:segregation and condensation protein B
VLYGTTREFLERLGLPSLDALPSLGDFVPDASVVEALERGLRVNTDPAAETPDADVPVEGEVGDGSTESD